MKIKKDKTKSFQSKKGNNSDYIPSQIKSVQTKGMKVVSYITTTSTTTVISINVQSHVQLVKSRLFISYAPYQLTFLKKTDVTVSSGKENRKRKAGRLLF